MSAVLQLGAASSVAAANTVEAENQPICIWIEIGRLFDSGADPLAGMTALPLNCWSVNVEARAGGEPSSSRPRYHIL
jgi:hypothetical protein